MSEWKKIKDAPQNGTWVLLRGRNAIGAPMIPVVAAWMPPGATHRGWCDSGSFRSMDSLAATPGADWTDLPE